MDATISVPVWVVVLLLLGVVVIIVMLIAFMGAIASDKPVHLNRGYSARPGSPVKPRAGGYSPPPPTEPPKGPAPPPATTPRPPAHG